MGKSRLANIECLRCIAMLFIVLNHCILNIATQYLTLRSSPLNFCITDFLYQIVYTGVNIFILISGYFLVDTEQKSTNWNKIFQLWLIVFFYSMSIYFLSIALNWETFGIQNLIHNLMPIKYDAYWFITQYIGLYIMSPYFAKWAHSMAKLEYKTMLISLFILTSIIQLAGLKGGFSLIWFIFLFMFAGYIRLHKDESSILQIWNKRAGSFFFLSSFLLFLLSFVINGGGLNIVSYFGFYNGPILFLSSVSIFLLFLKQKETNIIKQIAKISPYLFGIYLIHEHPILKEHLWLYLNNHITDVTVLNLLFIALAIFLACLIIEYVRQFLFNRFKINVIFNSITNSSLVFLKTQLKNASHYVGISKKEDN